MIKETIVEKRDEPDKYMELWERTLEKEYHGIEKFVRGIHPIPKPVGIPRTVTQHQYNKSLPMALLSTNSSPEFVLSGVFYRLYDGVLYLRGIGKFSHLTKSSPLITS